MLKLLRKIPILSMLASKDLRRVLKISSIRAFEPGEAIFSKQEAARHMFIVISGRIKIFTSSHGKKRKTFAYLHPGEFFGEMALVNGRSRSASAQAVRPSKLLLVDRSDFRRLLMADPTLSYFLLKTVSERLRHANEEIEGLLFRNILGRVSKQLFDLGEDAGKKFRGGVVIQDRYTHQELADLVGTTREPLTRALSTLRRADLIDVLDGRYFIKNREKLEALCLTA